MSKGGCCTHLARPRDRPKFAVHPTTQRFSALCSTRCQLSKCHFSKQSHACPCTSRPHPYLLLLNHSQHRAGVLSASQTESQLYRAACQTTRTNHAGAALCPVVSFALALAVMATPHLTAGTSAYTKGIHSKWVQAICGCKQYVIDMCMLVMVFSERMSTLTSYRGGQKQISSKDTSKAEW